MPETRRIPVTCRATCQNVTLGGTSCLFPPEDQVARGKAMLQEEFGMVPETHLELISLKMAKCWEERQKAREQTKQAIIFTAAMCIDKEAKRHKELKKKAQDARFKREWKVLKK